MKTGVALNKRCDECVRYFENVHPCIVCNVADCKLYGKDLLMCDDCCREIRPMP